MKFYLGTHCVNHVAEHPGIDWFLSRNRLHKRKTLPRISGGTAVVDVAGFTALHATGDYPFTDRDWAQEALRYYVEMVNIDWFPPRDWMCEPWIVKKTGLSVVEHQRRTVASFLNLREIVGLPWAPVLQGWEPEDYLRCVDMYADAGVDLCAETIVGVGSVCRRQGTAAAARIFASLYDLGIRLHGFGVKTNGLQRAGRWLASADSMAWSYDARRAEPLPGCTHKNCANCLRYALRWRASLLGRMAAWAGQREMDIFDQPRAA